MEIVDDVAYVASDGGIAIVDVSEPGTAKKTHQLGTDGPTFRLTVVDGFIYAAGDLGGITVVDLSALEVPSKIVQIANVGTPHRVTVVGNYAYLFGQTLSIVDITNPAFSRKVGELNVGGLVETDTYRSQIAGNYAYLAAGEKGLAIIDISDPTNPQFVTHVDTAGRAEDVATFGDHVYVADTRGGFAAIDITNPEQPMRFDATVKHDGWSGPHYYGWRVCLSHRQTTVAKRHSSPRDCQCSRSKPAPSD